MKFLLMVTVACLAAYANGSGIVNVYGAYDDGQWHGEGLWESQDHESAAVAYAHAFPPAVPVVPPVAYARAFPVAPVPAPVVARVLPGPVPAPYAVPAHVPGYAASISGPSGQISALS